LEEKRIGRPLAAISSVGCDARHDHQKGKQKKKVKFTKNEGGKARKRAELKLGARGGVLYGKTAFFLRGKRDNGLRNWTRRRMCGEVPGKKNGESNGRIEK